MTIWMHKESGKIMTMWQCYSCTDPFKKDYNSVIGLNLKSYQFMGVACDSGKGVTMVFHEKVLDEFEYLGEL